MNDVIHRLCDRTTLDGCFFDTSIFQTSLPPQPLLVQKVSFNLLNFNSPHRVGDRIRFSSVAIKVISEYFSREFDETLGILDFAPADPSVINFFSDFNYIYFASSNLRSTLLTLNERQPQESGNWVADQFLNALPSLKNYKGSQHLNLILVWDMFNYLDRKHIIDIMAMLSPMCKKGALICCFVWLTEKMPSLPGGFTLEFPDLIEYQFKTFDTTPSLITTTQSIVSLMPCFRPHRMLATENGILEIALEFYKLVDPPDPNIVPANHLTGVYR